MVMIGCYLGKACLLVLDVTFSFMLHQFYQSHLYLSILSSVPKNFTLYPKLDLKLFIYSHAKINNWIGVQQPSILVTEKKQYIVFCQRTLFLQLDRLSRHIDSPSFCILQSVPFERSTTLKLCTGQSFQHILQVHIAN